MNSQPKPWTRRERRGFATINAVAALAVLSLAAALLWPQYDIAVQRQAARAGLGAIRPIQTAVIEYATQHRRLPRSPQALVPHGIPAGGARSPSGPVAEFRFTDDGLIALRYRRGGDVPDGLGGKWLHLRPTKGNDDALGIEFCIAEAPGEDAVRKRYWPIGERTRRCPAE